MKEKETPLMRQYNQIKSKYPDTVLLYRLGDFFETFGDDAKITAQACGITLTKRNHGAAGDLPLAGFPHHQLDQYLPKLVKAGYRVAVCEQTEDPKLARGIVRRDVVEVVTPGVALYDKLLETKKNNYIACVYFGTSFKRSELVGLACADISTGEFFTAEITCDKLVDTLESLAPAELIISKAQKSRYEEETFKLSLKPSLTKLEEWIFELDFSREALLKQFKSKSLKGFGVDDLQEGLQCAGAIIHYVGETQRGGIGQLQSLKRYDPSEFMTLDFATRRNLEIIYTMEGSGDGALISILDKTCSAPGGRLFKKWISRPLKNLKQIYARLNAVEALKDNDSTRSDLRGILACIGDLERLASKVATGRANSRDCVALKSSLAQLPSLIAVVSSTGQHDLITAANKIKPLESLVAYLDKAVCDEPSIQPGTGNMFKHGFDAELDEYVTAKFSAKQMIADFQERERDRSGINSLKVSFNNVFGYYIEITRSQALKTPENYERKQTLANAERYMTPELKEIETKILTAEEKIIELENKLLNELKLYIAEFTGEIQNNAALVAALDCLQSFAQIAKEYDYVRPEIDDSDVLEIIDGRHPVVERLLPPGEAFTPNSTNLNCKTEQIQIITGPNMSGKSCYLRQTALIVLLGQIGCFVPAKSAKFGIIDRIFTRVGAQDNITAGESTFLVEMQESANILNNASDKSLILLDEVGRGTATFDGISIAWAIAEYLHDRIGAKTLFATHYHELIELEERYSRVVNYKVDVVQSGKNVIFTHKVVKGGGDKSFGIHVAEMAGLPRDVIDRAYEIIGSFEHENSGNFSKPDIAKIPEKKANNDQLAIFEFRDDILRERINSLSVDNLTPLQALQILTDLKAESRRKKR